MKIYIAGASTEAERCKALAWWVRSMGGEIAVPWWDAVLAAKVHDRELSEPARFEFAAQDLRGVDECALFWLVIPADGHGRGAWVEFGYAIGELLGSGARRRRTIVSGDWRASIFTSFADERFDTHEEALARVQTFLSEAA